MANADPPEADNNEIDTTSAEKKKVAVELWKHHSSFFFRELQTASFVEAAVLAGWYSLCPQEEWLAVAVLVLGTMLLFVLSLMLRRHAQHIRAFKKAAGDFLPDVPGPFLGLSGRRLGFWTPVFLGVVNLLLAFLTCFRIVGCTPE